MSCENCPHRWFRGDGYDCDITETALRPCVAEAIAEGFGEDSEFEAFMRCLTSRPVEEKESMEPPFSD